MILPVVLRAEAQAEFDEAFDYYEGQQAGLGVDFVIRVQRVFDRIAANPLLHGVILSDIRKAVVTASLTPCFTDHTRIGSRLLQYSTVAATLAFGKAERNGVACISGWSQVFFRRLETSLTLLNSIRNRR